MIGANNYGFAAIVERCVTNWLTSPSWWKNYCSDDSDMTSRFTAARQAQETTQRQGRAAAGARRDDQRGLRRLAVHDHRPDLLDADPARTGFRYGETGWTRQSVGGCGVWNRDANWAHDTVVAAMNGSVRNGAAQAGRQLVVLDLQNALDGRRLCETGVGLLEEVGTSTWQSPGAVDRTEWVSQIRTATTIVGPYQLQEDSHASYWGQLAMRNCLRLAYNGGAVRGGRCVRVANGLNAARGAADGAAVARKRRSRSALSDDGDARERHREAGQQRVQQAGRRERDRGDVVAERPAEVLA